MFKLAGNRNPLPLLIFHYLFLMSKSVNDLLTDIAARCNIRDNKVLRKSKELFDLLKSKQQVICSDTCKAVACLELATSLTPFPLNRDEAVKYSGCRKKNYTNIYNNISKLLNLDKIYSVKEICLMIGMSDIQNPVNKLLENFKSSCQDIESDFDHPMYPCAAVLAFCRENKLKLNQTKIFEISRVKKSELENLVKKFQVLLAGEAEHKKIDKKGNKSSKIIRKPLKVEDNEITPQKRKASSGVMSDKEYEEWKRKMLED